MTRRRLPAKDWLRQFDEYVGSLVERRDSLREELARVEGELKEFERHGLVAPAVPVAKAKRRRNNVPRGAIQEAVKKLLAQNPGSTGADLLPKVRAALKRRVPRQRVSNALGRLFALGYADRVRVGSPTGQPMYSYTINGPRPRSQKVARRA